MAAHEFQFLGHNQMLPHDKCVVCAGAGVASLPHCLVVSFRFRFAYGNALNRKFAASLAAITTAIRNHK